MSLIKRGRPKGRSQDSRSFGPLGDLIRKHRLQKGFGLAEVAIACDCSVQFISNIEHGRAPLPWEKVTQLAKFLKIQVEELQAANLSIRSDFKGFAANSKSPKMIPASAVALTAKDAQLQEIIQKYQLASIAARKKFVKSALKMLN